MLSAFRSRKWGAQIIWRSSPFAHSLEKLLFPSFFPVQDPADRNRHARHLDVIPTLVARLEGLWLGPGRSWTAQAVIPSRNSNYGATTQSCCKPALVMMTLLLRLYDLLRLQRRCAVEVHTIRNGTLPAFFQVGTRPQWRSQQTSGQLRWAIV